jgi:hypothetical protein
MAGGAPKGHKKYGGGIKKGQRHKKTIDIEKAREIYKQEVLSELKPLLISQLQSAKGLFVVLRRGLVKGKNGKLYRGGQLEQVKDPFEIQQLLNSDGQGEDWHIITSKEPNIVALKDILDRAFGRPTETIEHKGDVRLLIMDI